MRQIKRMAARIPAAMAAAALLIMAAHPAAANHGDIHATCKGAQPVVTARPPGTEHVNVVCRDGFPEFLVDPGPVPVYNPVTQAQPLLTPPDFGGWVTVWRNASQSPLIWYDMGSTD